jgi:hypothetical protein
MDEDTDLAFSMATLRAFFDPHTLPLWVRSFKLRTFGLIPLKQTIPLGLAVVLRLITIKFNHPLIIPGFFLLVGVVFYIVTVAIMHIPVQQLREAGWIFDLGNVDNEWYESYTEFGEWCSNLGSSAHAIQICATRTGRRCSPSCPHNWRSSSLPCSTSH